MIKHLGFRGHKKYFTIGIIFILLIVNVNNSISLQINDNNLTKETQSIKILDFFVNDGYGLTVEIINKGNFNIENINLTIEIDSNKYFIIPNNIFNISYITVGNSTKVHVVIFGFSPLFSFNNPLITIKVSSPFIESFYKIFSIKIFGFRTKILEEVTFSGEPYEGYTLYSPEYSTYTYLLDMDGKIVYTWNSNYVQGFGAYLLENGDLLRLDEFGTGIRFIGGGRAGRVEKFDKDSNLLWEFEYANNEHCSHHNFKPLPNGNILLIAWEYKSFEEAVSAGRNPNPPCVDLWPDHIIEVEPTGTSGGNIVWEWHVWDHMIQDYDPTKDNYGVIKEHPELININYGVGNQDWNHINAVDYNEDLDQILLSVRYFNEIWIIDHSTTTEEAAGHTGGKSGKGGDLLYRWGNPRAYGAAQAYDQQLFEQHGANWIKKGCPGEGNIIVFNNGRPAFKISSVVEIVPPVDNNGNYEYLPGASYGPNIPIWIYQAKIPMDLYSFTLSSVQRLPNGNTLICSANQGLFIEVTPDKNVVWQYKNTLPTSATNCVAQIYRYPLDYPGIPKVKINTEKNVVQQ